jgi:hypothetical protein
MQGVKNTDFQTCLEILEEDQLQQMFIAEQAYFGLFNVTDLLKESVSRHQVNILSLYDNRVSSVNDVYKHLGLITKLSVMCHQQNVNMGTSTYHFIDNGVCRA